MLWERESERERERERARARARAREGPRRYMYGTVLLKEDSRAPRILALGRLASVLEYPDLAKSLN